MIILVTIFPMDYCDDYCTSLNVHVTSSLTTLVMECLNVMACEDVKIFANASNSVQLKCGGVNPNYPGLEHSSCSGYLCTRASDVQNDVEIVCNGDAACAGAYFHSPNGGNSLNVTCDGEYSCAGASIYCSKDVPCNIGCLATSSSSCVNTQFHITSKADHKLNLYCSSSAASCIGADFVCEDT
eukprot:280104_1